MDLQHLKWTKNVKPADGDGYAYSQFKLQAAVNESVGALGLPDAIETREKIEDIATSNNSAVKSVDKATHEINRQITRASADTALSKQGQQLTKQQVEKTQTSIQQVEASGKAAQDDVVTQNVMKRIAQQNTQIAGILGVMRTDGLTTTTSISMRSSRFSSRCILDMGFVDDNKDVKLNFR
jgi:septal ring factor EnvC (AmiA/AmiB activator)